MDIISDQEIGDTLRKHGDHPNLSRLLDSLRSESTPGQHEHLVRLVQAYFDVPTDDFDAMIVICGDLVEALLANLEETTFPDLARTAGPTGVQHEAAAAYSNRSRARPRCRPATALLRRTRGSRDHGASCSCENDRAVTDIIRPRDRRSPHVPGGRRRPHHVPRHPGSGRAARESLLP
jgi:hypothetical protein